MVGLVTLAFATALPLMAALALNVNANDFALAIVVSAMFVVVLIGQVMIDSWVTVVIALVMVARMVALAIVAHVQYPTTMTVAVK